ncbi:MAG: hypothetical protein U9O96_06780, partial [Candidatus Thermoplasmatota archaeon]|nr:hypothetical protein [Candidatus Thermoplasmatota archaeon]
WTKVVQGGFGSDQAHRNNVAVMCAKVFKGKLYIGTMNWQTGCEVYRSKVSNPSSNSDWGRVVNKGFKDFEAGTYYYKNRYAWSMEVFNGSDNIERLYVGTFNPKTGFHVYRTSNGTSWSYVTKNGFGYSLDWGARTMKEFKGKLYVGTARNFISGANAGCTIWRSSTGNPGSFSKVATNGFGNKYNRYAWSMEEYDAPNGQKQLWVGTANVRLTYSNPRSEGCEVWFSDDGTNWHLSVDGGFGNKYNEGARTLKSYDPPGSHPNGLYMGTYHLRLIGYTNGGCEVWRRETAGSSS